MRVKSGTDSRRGQSLVEVALMMPVLIMLLLGMVEVVNIGRTYLALLDTSYQGAHLGSQGLSRYDNTKIYTLVEQDLTNKGYNTSALNNIITTRAKISGGVIDHSTYATDKRKGGGRSTVLTETLLNSRLRGGDPAGRLIVVEIVYDYTLLFPWPNLAGVFPNPFPLVAYTIQYVAR